MANQDITQEFEFRRHLIDECNGKKENTTLLRKEEYYELIQELKEANDAPSKSRRQYYILSRFALLSYLKWIDKKIFNDKKFKSDTSVFKNEHESYWKISTNDPVDNFQIFK